MKNNGWVLKQRPEGNVDADALELVDLDVLPLQDGQVLVRTYYITLNRIWMSDGEQYLEPVKVGEIMRGNSFGVVEESRSERPGDIVSAGLGGWQAYVVEDATKLGRVRRLPDVPLTAHMSVLGHDCAWLTIVDLGAQGRAPAWTTPAA